MYYTEHMSLAIKNIKWVGEVTAKRCDNTVLKINVTFYSSQDQCELDIFALDTHTLLYVESTSAWSNQGSVMCLLSILNQ